MLNVIKRSVGRSQLALVGTLLLLGATGCESLRELSWNQGEGENLYELSAFKGSTFKATTGAKRFKGQTSRADQLVVLPGFDKLNNLDAVELQFTEGLFAGVNLSDFIFYGRENHEYTFRYDFTDDFVILSKIAAVQDIPSQELTYAESVGEGLYRVPMMGLPISLFAVEIVRDERGKDTRKQGEFKKDYLHEATHFRISLEGIKYIETTGKQDLLPVTFFNPEDEWFFTKTLVGRPINSLSILGSQVQALKIKFARTNNSVIGVDLNIAPEQVVLDPTKTITALEFPVEWVDYRLEKSGEKAYLKETKLGDEEPTSKYWMERQYALMDFNNADRLDRAFTLDNKLEKLEIGNDYLSFNIYESTTGNTYKYSLAKVNRQVPGQVLHADDATLFHVFSQRKKVIDGNLFTQSPDIDNIMFGTRFYPDESKPEIVYHLSDNSPDVPEFEEAVRTAIDSWDQAFQAAGTDIRVRFDDHRVELGDVRYNQIVLYGYEIDSRMEGGGMLLGFGPSLQDTRSGLTYSAATHIYLRAYREGLISSIRSFVRSELGLYTDKKLSSVPSFAYADSLESLTPPVVGNSNSSGLFQLVNFLNDTRVFPNPDFSRNYVERLMPSELAKRSLESFQWTPAPKVAKLDGECEHGAVAARSTSWKKIRETCLVSGNHFNDYLETLKVAHQGNPAIVNLANEEEAVLACAQPLMKDLLISTLIHEVGHNLGLGHNFAASSDGDNFARTAEGKVAYPSSSVMDYPDRDYDVFSKAGPYDVATLRYLYGRKVELANGELMDIPAGKSAVSTARGNGVKLKPYRMCTDFEALDNNLPDFDPLCSRWDVGTNPREYVLWATRKIHQDIIENGYRYNDVWFSGANAGLNYFINFKQIHDYFRYLVAKQVGVHFEKMRNPADEQELLAAIGKTSNPQLTQSYYDGVKEIYKFTRELLNLTSRTCVVEVSGSLNGEVVEFRDLRDQIFEQHQVTIQNCAEAQALALPILAANGETWATEPTAKLLDRGAELVGYEISMDPAAAADIAKQTWHNLGYWDLRYSSGVESLKAMAIAAASARGTFLRTTQAAGVTSVNLLDFPWFARPLYDDAVERMEKGLELKHVDAALPGRAPIFREYEYFNFYLLRTLLNGGLDQRSPSFGLALDMYPDRENSTTTFQSRYGTSEEDIWSIANTARQVHYSTGDTRAGRLIRTLVEAQQFSLLNAFVNALRQPQFEAPIQAELDKLDASLSLENRLFQASLNFYAELGGLTLQPAQKKMLRKALQDAIAASGPPAPAGQAAFLRSVLLSFTANARNPMVMELAAKGDQENLSALVNTLNDYISSF